MSELKISRSSSGIKLGSGSRIHAGGTGGLGQYGSCGALGSDEQADRASADAITQRVRFILSLSELGGVKVVGSPQTGRQGVAIVLGGLPAVLRLFESLQGLLVGRSARAPALGHPAGQERAHEGGSGQGEPCLRRDDHASPQTSRASSTRP